MIAMTDITADLQIYWMQNTPESVPTQFPGVPLDASSLKLWMEFWITQSLEPPHRVRTSDEILVLLDVHCFSRQADKRAVWRLADQVRSVLSQKTLEIHCSAADGAACGYLRLLESTCRDLTRESQPDPRLPLQHLVISISGRAESVSTLSATE